MKKLYTDAFREIKTSPFESKSRQNIDQIYVNLSLLIGEGNDYREEISYENAIRLLTKRYGKTRVVFLGEAGVGKSTLLVKIARDWALDRHLTDVDLLLFIPMRDIKKASDFSDILQIYSSHKIKLNSKRVEEYIRNNEDKVMILMDGLDEYTGNVKNPEPGDILIRILKGYDLTLTPVIVTTRPWGAEQITSTQGVTEKYSRVLVEGFRKDDVKEYIRRFFSNDPGSAKGLSELMTEDSLVATNMAPYPIFCCMLCNMWKEESKRKIIIGLQTFSQLFKEMIASLTGHWISKTSFRDYLKRCEESLEEIGSVAFHGLLDNKLVFTEQAFKDRIDAMRTCCEIGVLSSEKKFALGDEPNAEVTVSFPHKLFQEYLAGLYLASLYHFDESQFRKLLKERVFAEYEQFKYVLYFTVAHGKKEGRVRKALMEAICAEINDEEFIVDLAFECHDRLAIHPVLDLFRNKTSLQLSARTQILQKHTWAGYMHILAACGDDVVSGSVLYFFCISN